MRPDVEQALRAALRNTQKVVLDDKGPGTFEVLVDVGGKTGQIKGDDPEIRAVIEEYMEDPYNF